MSLFAIHTLLNQRASRKDVNILHQRPWTLQCQGLHFSFHFHKTKLTTKNKPIKIRKLVRRNTDGKWISEVGPADSCTAWPWGWTGAVCGSGQHLRKEGCHLPGEWHLQRCRGCPTSAQEAFVACQCFESSRARFLGTWHAIYLFSNTRLRWARQFETFELGKQFCSFKIFGARTTVAIFQP